MLGKQYAAFPCITYRHIAVPRQRLPSGGRIAVQYVAIRDSIRGNARFNTWQYAIQYVAMRGSIRGDTRFNERRRERCDWSEPGRNGCGRNEGAQPNTAGQRHVSGTAEQRDVTAGRGGTAG